MPVFWHTLNIFSEPGCRFELISFAFFKIKNVNIILRYTPLEGGQKIFYRGKKIFPDGPYIIIIMTHLKISEIPEIPKVKI